MHANLRKVLLAATIMCAAPSAFANVITDWDEKAVLAVTPMAALNGTSPYTAIRLLAMVHAAMFDAVNSIERRYQPYLVQLPADPTTSKDAAAAAAAATVLATIDDKTAGDMKRALAAYLASIPDGVAKSDGINLGESVAAKLLDARGHDGSATIRGRLRLWYRSLRTSRRQLQHQPRTWNLGPGRDAHRPMLSMSAATRRGRDLAWFACLLRRRRRQRSDAPTPGGPGAGLCPP